MEKRGTEKKREHWPIKAKLKKERTERGRIERDEVSEGRDDNEDNEKNSNADAQHPRFN
jgi:hypothetical protein